MADVNIDPFGEHDKAQEPTGEDIPLHLVTPVGGRSTWEPTREQETSFGGRESQRNRVLRDRVERLYRKLSQKLPRTSEVCHYDLFELRNGKLYFRDKSTLLTTKKGGLKLVKEILKILGKEGLRNLDFDIPKGKITSRQAVLLNEAEEELPSSSAIAKADIIELEEIVKSTEDLIYQINNQSQTDDLFKHPLRELLGLDAQLRSIRGLLKVEVARKVQLEERIKKDHCKLEEFREYPGVYDDAMREGITK